MVMGLIKGSTTIIIASNRQDGANHLVHSNKVKVGITPKIFLEAKVETQIVGNQVHYSPQCFYLRRKISYLKTRL